MRVKRKVQVCANNGSEQIIHLNELLPVNFSVITSNLQLIDTLSADTCVIYTISGIYTLGGSCVDNNNIVEVISANDTISDDECVTVYPFCAAQADRIIPDSSFATTYGPGFFNQTIYIDGRFYVDTNFFTIQNCTILVNTGGQIIVLSGAALEIDSSLIKGCDNMWRGIYLENTGSVGIWKHSIIRDADVAVYANDRSSVKILHSSIEDFVKGFYVPPHPTLGVNSVHQNIYGSRFGLFGASLKPPYPGQAPYGLLPRSGIEVNDVIMEICDGLQDSNYFYNINKGIYGNRSDLTVINNRFSDISIDSLYTEVWDGTAVVSLGMQSNHIPAFLTVGLKVAAFFDSL